MSRLHRKCLLTSAGLHALLLLVLFFSAAFLDVPPKIFHLEVLDYIPSTLVDAELYGGGDPDVQPPPPEPEATPHPALPVTKPEPTPPQPEPEPSLEPEPPVRTKEPEVKVTQPKPPPVKPKPAVKVQIKTRRVEPPSRRTETEKAKPNVANELASRFTDTTSRLSRQLTPKTTIGVPGPGGEAFANYSQAIISIYEQAWIKPIGIEKACVVKATVTIARDGRVLSFRITRLSGNATVDDSVEQVLQRVKETRPFPEGAKDPTRIFNLSFELNPADLTG
jgi:periplasmic protein TonB